MHRFSSFATFSAVILAGLWLTSCKKEEAVALPPPVVTVAQAVDQQVQDWDEYTGRLAAVSTVDIRARVSGYLTEVKFKDGDLVKKGQPLFIIDPRPYQADFDKIKGEADKAESALKLANIEFERAKQLRDKGVTSATDFDQRAAALQQATGNVLAARAAVSAAQLNLEFCTITAPIDGRASLAKITVGNLVSADSNQPLTTIVSTNPIYAYVDVDERSLLRYARYYQKHGGGGDDAVIPIELALQDEKTYIHKGRIDFVDNRVDPATGTIRLRGVFDTDNGLLGPGLFVRVRIPAGEPYQAVVVPQRSVAADQGHKFVVVVEKDNTAMFRPVETGTNTGAMTVIKSGVKTGETVVVDGLLKIRPGEKVDPKPLSAAPQASPTPAATPDK
ncbi:MAG: efflux RND transporter periplasmic adaptor subunit [Chthoniobacterales bacterium]